MSEFAGVSQRVMDQRQVRVVYTQCPAGSRIPDHQHENAFLSFLIDGDYLEGSGAKMQSCRANDLTWHPPGDRHEVHHGPGEVHSLQIEFTRPEFEGWKLDSLPRARTTEFFPQVRALILDIHAEMRQADAFTDAAVRGRLLQLLARLGRTLGRERDDNQRVAAAVEQSIQAGFPDPPDIPSLAETLGLTEARLGIAFRHQTGLSLRQGWNRYRLAQACDRLLDSDQPIAQVALECGYYDQSHFTHSFSKAMKCTPGAYRKSR
jgi:AraC family transcriptional regulator